MSLYEKCKVDPTDKDFMKNFRDLHPEFRESLDFLKDVKAVSFCTYVVLTYDIESPFVIRYRDWAQRRRETARLCKFPTEESGHYTREAEDIILGNNPKANKIIITYLSIQNDLDFINYQSYQALFYRQTLAAVNSSFDNPGHYDKLKQNLDSLTADIKSLQNSIFHGDETKEMKKALYDFVSQMSLEIRPEQVAERKLKGEEIVDESPYPDNYKPSKLKFVSDE